MKNKIKITLNINNKNYKEFTISYNNIKPIKNIHKFLLFEYIINNKIFYTINRNLTFIYP